MKHLLLSFSMLLIATLMFNQAQAQTNCHPYIQQLSNGSVRFSVTFAQAQAYVEVFARKNGSQNIAVNITGSQIANANGTYTYSYTVPASTYASGDVISTRFYSYRTGQQGVFTPGPGESVWASDFVYNQTCNTSVYVSINGSDANPGTISSPVRTITKGVALAANQGKKEVKVAAGTYVEGNINVVNGISLLGGYSPNFTTRDLSFTQYVTTIDANQPNVFGVCGEKRILNITNVYLSTIIEGFVMTRGRLCGYGGGIYMNTVNNLLIIRNNRILNNYSVGSGTSAGGNVYITNGSPQIYNNIITGGFAGANIGNDLYVASTQPHSIPFIQNNTFTTESAVFGLEKTNHSGNKYLNQSFVHVSLSGNDTGTGTNESPVRTIAKGIELAKAIGAREVRIASGTFIEGNLVVENGISIYGGYSAEFTTYDPIRNVTTIDAQQPSGAFVCGSKRIFKIENITQFTVISGLTMKGGRLCDFGGGIYINNSGSMLLIQDNILNGNASVGNGTSRGGNIYINNSAPRIINNQIINGFAGAGLGNDIYINATTLTSTEIAYNVITSPSSIYGGQYANVHDNTYLNPSAVAREGAENEYMPLEVKIMDHVAYINTDGELVGVEIIDMMGKTCIFSTSKVIPLTGITPGVYIIKAESSSALATEKVLIQ